MKLLHPYMPFITEEIYRHLVVDDESIMISKWPVTGKTIISLRRKEDEPYHGCYKSIRNIRRRWMFLIPERQKPYLSRPAAANRIYWKKERYSLKDLLHVRKLLSSWQVRNTFQCRSCDIGRGWNIPSLEDLIDIEKEIERLRRTFQSSERIGQGKQQTGNEGFVSKAPQKVVEEEKKKKENIRKCMIR